MYELVVELFFAELHMCTNCPALLLSSFCILLPLLQRIGGSGPQSHHHAKTDWSLELHFRLLMICVCEVVITARITCWPRHHGSYLQKITADIAVNVSRRLRPSVRVHLRI